MNLLRFAQIRQLDVFQLDTQIFEEGLATSQDCEVFHHRLATIAVTRSLDRSDLHDATHLVDNQSCQCFAFDVFCNDQQRHIALGDRFQQRNQLLCAADLFFVQQNAAVLHHNFLLIFIGDEVWRQVATIKLHTFNKVNFRRNVPTFFNGNYTVLADLHQSVRKELPNVRIVVSSNRCNLRDGLTVSCFDWLGHLLQSFDHSRNSLLSTTAQSHRVSTGRKILQGSAVDRF